MASHRLESAGKAIEMTKRGNYALIVLSLNLQILKIRWISFAQCGKTRAHVRLPSLPQ